ncbi:Putative exported protein precursor [Yersinia enterocolitica]|nr:Putative exported protein precursor [Yersinia enterocolitica]
MANAESIELLPGVSLQIGEQDRSGNYWDGYDWRDQQWWQNHQGRDLGERNRHGHYWDGHRWQHKDWWKRTTTIVMGTIGNMINIIKNRVKNIIAAKAMITMIMIR